MWFSNFACVADAAHYFSCLIKGLCVSEGVCSLSSPADIPMSSSSLEGQTSQPAEGHEDPELSSWLRLYGADQDSIDRVGLCFYILVQDFALIAKCSYLHSDGTHLYRTYSYV